ncbi:unnamed protein product, partial [Amoebophrya sp. A120]
KKSRRYPKTATSRSGRQTIAAAKTATAPGSKNASSKVWASYRNPEPKELPALSHCHKATPALARMLGRRKYWPGRGGAPLCLARP